MLGTLIMLEIVSYVLRSLDVQHAQQLHVQLVPHLKYHKLEVDLVLLKLRIVQLYPQQTTPYAKHATLATTPQQEFANPVQTSPVAQHVQTLEFVLHAQLLKSLKSEDSLASHKLPTA